MVHGTQARALLLVDIQNDFLPGGQVPVPGGDEVVSVANRLMGRFPLVVATQDWHPPNHESFASNHPDRGPGDSAWFGGKEQQLWPDHCIQGTAGADFAAGLQTDRIDRVFRKGVAVNADGYSGFGDARDASGSQMADYLREHAVKEIFLMGLATDFCVKATALDACREGFQVYLVEDGCRGVNQPAGSVEEAKERMQRAGVRIRDSDELFGVS